MSQPEHVVETMDTWNDIGMKGTRAHEGGYRLGDKLNLANGSKAVVIGAEDGFLRIQWEGGGLTGGWEPWDRVDKMIRRQGPTQRNGRKA